MLGFFFFHPQRNIFFCYHEHLLLCRWTTLSSFMHIFLSHYCPRNYYCIIIYYNWVVFLRLLCAEVPFCFERPEATSFSHTCLFPEMPCFHFDAIISSACENVTSLTSLFLSLSHTHTSTVSTSVLTKLSVLLYRHG